MIITPPTNPTTANLPINIITNIRISKHKYRNKKNTKTVMAHLTNRQRIITSNFKLQHHITSNFQLPECAIPLRPRPLLNRQKIRIACQEARSAPELLA